MTFPMITDDEVAALAVAARGAWPVALPTVTAGDSRELTAAVMRGHRSLAARELVPREGDPDFPLAVATRAFLEADEIAVGAVVDAEAPHTGRGDQVIGALAADGGCVSDSVAMSGIHRWENQDAFTFRSRLAQIAAEVWTNGVGGDDDGSGLAWMVATNAKVGQAVLVSQGSVKLLSLTGAEVTSSETVAAASADDAASVVRELLGFA